MSKLENIIESLYFSASRPISESEIVKILNDSNYDLKAVKNAISILEKKYQESSFELVKVASGHRFRIKQEYLLGYQSYGLKSLKNIQELCWKHCL